MSGLFGIVDFASPVLERDIELMGRILSHRGRGAPKIWIGKRAALGFLDSHTLDENRRCVQPVEDSSYGKTLLFDGRLDNRQELQQKLHLHENIDALLVLEGFLRLKDEIFSLLLGDFAVALWDAREEKLFLARDAVGLRPLFYYKDSRWFIFASESKAILCLPGVRRAPDETFLRAFDKARLREHTRTFFEGIYRVCPGEIVTVKQDGVCHNPYWKPDVSVKTKQRSDDDVQSEFKKTFYSAVESRLPENGKAAIFLSGGLDSSSVASVASDIVRMKKMPVDIETFSLISRRFPEEDKYSGAAAKALGLEQEMADMDGIPLKDSLEKLVVEFESPFISPYDVFFKSLYQKAAQRGARVLFTGDWGDQTQFCGAYLADILLEGKWKKFLDEFPQFCRHEQASALYVLKRLFWYFLAPRFHTPKYKTRGQKELYECVFYPENVLIMETLERAAAHAGLELRLPFLDLRLFNFLMQTPSECRMKNGLGKMLLCESLKDVLPEKISQNTEKISGSAYLLKRFHEAGFTGSTLEDVSHEWDIAVRELWMRQWFSKKN